MSAGPWGPPTATSFCCDFSIRFHSFVFSCFFEGPDAVVLLGLFLLGSCYVVPASPRSQYDTYVWVLRKVVLVERSHLVYSLAIALEVEEVLFETRGPFCFDVEFFSCGVCLDI